MAENTDNTEYPRKKLMKDLADALEEKNLLLQQLNCVLKTHQAQAAQLAAQQAQFAAQQAQFAAQQAQLDSLKAFRADILLLYGTSAQTDVVEAMLMELGRNPELARVIGSTDQQICVALLDNEVDPTLMQFFPQPEHDDEDDENYAESEAFHRDCITKFNNAARAALERMVTQNPSAPAFGTTAEILAKILKGNCKSDDPYFFHMAYSQVKRNPEWETLYQAWDDANSASQEQPSSAGKQVKPCREWQRTGTCHRGESCWFLHEGCVSREE
jgi:hypothetical protein